MSWCLVGSEMCIRDSAKLHLKTGTLLGKAVDVQFQPTQTSWVFGDGSVATGAAANHQFWGSGNVTISVTVTYAVAYQVAGTSTWVDSGSIAVGDSTSILVSGSGDSATTETPPPDGVSKVVRIVGKNCLENPGAFGCTL
jgi:hypothetical protein